MCMICKDWELGKLTSKEALRNLGEVMAEATKAGRAHYDDVVEKILNKEVPLDESDEELDKSWHEETHGGKP